MRERESLRPQSTGEEIANSISHGVALLAAIAASPVLIVGAVQRGEPSAIVGASVFSFAMILLYLSSTLYHALPRGKAKDLFQLFDHMAIFLLIAGTYTPFMLGVLRGPWGWTLLGIVWGFALSGILLKSIAGTRFMLLSTGLYVAMGWLVLIAFKPLMASMPATGLCWLLAGGLAYTLGVVFFILDHKIRYSHFVWHLCVTSGTTCHCVAVMGFSQ